jgi:cleavage and polyadenylation specificity factor subunit 2
MTSLAKQIDAVLFSHADLEHLGGYPYAVANLGLTCPSYSTFPLHDLGQACLLDAIKTRRSQDDFSLFNAHDVQTAFEKTIQLRYSQPLSLSGKLKGVTITAYGAGHSLGGTIWKIKKGTDEIVYAVDYNHGRERCRFLFEEDNLIF